MLALLAFAWAADRPLVLTEREGAAGPCRRSTTYPASGRPPMRGAPWSLGSLARTARWWMAVGRPGDRGGSDGEPGQSRHYRPAAVGAPGADIFNGYHLLRRVRLREI